MDKKTLEIQIKLLANQALTQVKEFSNDIKNAADKAKGFTGDAKGVATSIKTMQAEAQRTANQLKLFGLTSSDLRNTTQNLKKTILDLTDSGLKPESKEVQNLVQKYKELEEQTNKAEASEQGLFGVIGKLKNEIGSLAAVAAAVKVDQAVGNLAKSSLDVNNSFQKIKDDFGIMLGDVEAGIGLFNELQEFNFWTPFDIEQTSQAAKVLVSAKVPLKDLTDYLTRFGDIAQGDAQKFQSYINAFSKASAKGKADMEVLNVYTDQGVQILDALGQQLGKTSAEIVKMASEGKISFQDLDDALNALASEGGLYYGTLEKAAMRLDAVQAGLQESVKSLKASFGEMLAPAVAKVLSLFTDIVDKINSSPILKGILAAAIATITVAVNALAVVAIVKLIANLNLASVAVAGLGAAINTALPIVGMISVAVGLVTTALVANASAHQKAADAAAEHAKQMKELDNAYKDWLKTADETEARMAAQNYAVEAGKQRNRLNSLKQQLSATPQTITKNHGTTIGDITYTNPEYARIQAEIKEAEELLADYEQKSKAAGQRITQAQREEAQKREDIQKKLAEAVKKLGNDWQNKLADINASDSLEKLAVEQQQALEKLYDKAASLYEGDVNKWEAYQKEKKALSEYYNKKIADEEKKLSDKIREETEKSRKVLQDWIDKGDPIGTLERQKSEALKKNAEAAEKLYGKTYAKEADYIKANAELIREYDKKIAEEREKSQKTLIEDSKKAQEEYWKEEAEKAVARLRNGNISAYNVGQYTQSQFMTSIEGTDLGNVLNSISAVGSALVSLVAAFVSCLLEVENFKKILNWASTIMEKIFEYIGPVINDILAPIVELLEVVGETVGQILVPLLSIIQLLTTITGATIIIKTVIAILQVLGGVFEWLHNKVIVPFGNAVIDMANGLIDLLNKIPFVNIKKFEKLKYIGDIAVEVAEELDKSLELTRKKFERQKDAVNDLLQSQLDSIKTQYELGLISRKDYETKASKYYEKADKEIIEIEKEMNRKLEDIKNNTGAVLTEEQKATVSKTASSVSNKTNDSLSNTTSLDLTKSVKKEQLTKHTSDMTTEGFIAVFSLLGEKIKKGWKGLGDLTGWWDVGTSNQPFDQFGMLHQGEIVVPRTFSDGIRSGELSLSRNKEGGNNSSPIYVTVNVGGSVLAENELVDTVYNGLVKGIERRQYTPLGA